MPSNVDLRRIEYLKSLLQYAWKRVYEITPGENVYAFGFLTSDSAEFMFPFACGEVGLKYVAERYLADNEIYQSLAEAIAGLRWSFADSPYNGELDEDFRNLKPAFADRPNPYSLPESEFENEVAYRLNAACAAIHALDDEGFFGRKQDREKITLLIDGGDCSDEWLLQWAEKLNPTGVYQRFARDLQNRR